jgi:hypothetical protein
MVNQQVVSGLPMWSNIIMKSLIGVIVLIFTLILVPAITNAMWVKLSDIELVKQSDVIITAELIGNTQVTINQAKTVIGILKVEEVLKGDKNQTVILLALPSHEGPLKSDDIFYKTGQNGLWLLRERKTKGESGIYLADHPQSFITMERAGGQIKSIQKILEDKGATGSLN